MKIYFSDFFEIDSNLLVEHGAFNISLINDLPLFIDPFLLFGSEKQEYQRQHDNILKYLTFLKSKSGELSNGQIKSWYKFSEVKQNWFGYSKIGNSGSGLGMKFGKNFSASISDVFDDLGKEVITQTSHLEKSGLFEIGVGKDNISDFTTNLIKEFLLEYTQTFTLQNISPKFRKTLSVERVYFDYEFERWMPKEYVLPYFKGDYVILTPKDILTKDDSWINSNDLRGEFRTICNSIDNDQLRNEILNYFQKVLPKNKKNSQKDKYTAVQQTIRKYPEIINWYIKLKEENKVEARRNSKYKVETIEECYNENLPVFIDLLRQHTSFYDNVDITGLSEKRDKLMEKLNFIRKEGAIIANPIQKFENKERIRETENDIIEVKEKISEVQEKQLITLKNFIEGGNNFVFYFDNNPISRLEDLQIMYRFIWNAFNDEESQNKNDNFHNINFKLASSLKIKSIDVDKIRVIHYYTDSEYERIQKLLQKLKIDKNVILIDVGR